MDVWVLGIGSETFVEDLEASGIKYARHVPRPGVIMNAGESIEIAKTVAGLIPYAAVATVLVAWLKARSSREVMITLEDNKIFHAKGLSIEEVERLLKKAKTFAVMETKKPDSKQD